MPTNVPSHLPAGTWASTWAVIASSMRCCGSISVASATVTLKAAGSYSCTPLTMAPKYAPLELGCQAKVSRSSLLYAATASLPIADG